VCVGVLCQMLPPRVHRSQLPLAGELTAECEGVWSCFVPDQVSAEQHPGAALAKRCEGQQHYHSAC
jgi:hypothetical protein